MIGKRSVHNVSFNAKKFRKIPRSIICRGGNGNCTHSSIASTNFVFFKIKIFDESDFMNVSENSEYEFRISLFLYIV